MIERAETVGRTDDPGAESARVVVNWEHGHTEPALRHWPAVIEFLGFVPFEIGESLGERIRAWRTIHGVPRSELAARLGVDPSTVWRWENGDTTPHPSARDMLERLLDSLVSQPAGGWP